MLAICDAPIVVDKNEKKIYYQNAYYYIGHFSKFIKPGAKIVASNCNNPKLEVLVGRNNDNSLVIVIFNKNQEEIEFGIKIAGEIFSGKSSARSISTIILQNQ